MSGDGVYRQPGLRAAGLPFPREHLRAFGGLVIAAATLAFGLPLVAFAALSGSFQDAVVQLHEGSVPMMGLLLLTNVLAAITLGFLGLFAIRGRKLPPMVLVSLPALPFALAIGGATRAWAIIGSAIAAAPTHHVRPLGLLPILAQGVGETTRIDRLGGLVAGSLALAAAVAGAGAVATIRPKRDGAPRSTRWLSTLGCGAVWLTLTIAFAVVRGRAYLLPALPIALAVPLFARAARVSEDLTDWHDGEEARRVVGLFAVGAISLLFSTIAFEYAIDATVVGRGLISQTDPDLAVRVEMLGRSADAARLTLDACTVHLVFALLLFFFALSRAGLPPPIPMCTAVSVLCGLFFVTTLTMRMRVAGPSVMPHAGLASDAPTFELPTLRRSVGDNHVGERLGFTYAVRRMSNATDRLCATPTPAATQDVYVERGVTIAEVVSALRAPASWPHCSTAITFVTYRTNPVALDAQLGYLAPFLGSVAFLKADIDGFRFRRHVGTLHVIAETATDYRVEGDKAEVDGIVYTFPPTMKFDHALEVISAVENAHASRLHSWELARNIDCPACEASPPPASPPPASPPPTSPSPLP